MNTHRTSKRAFTLVEMLVVVAVITIITAITIPAAIRSGLFNSRETTIAGREMFETLRAAKIYAATNNVEVAVAYVIGIRRDSVTDIEVPVLDAVGFVRRLTREELDQIVDGNSLRDIITLTSPAVPGGGRDPDTVYVLVSPDDAGFVPMDANTCVLSDVLNVTMVFGEPVSDTALSAISILKTEVLDAAYLPPVPIAQEKDADALYLETRPEINPVAPVLVADLLDFLEPPNPGGDPISDRMLLYPAHVFLPSGEIDSASTAQRVTFRVGVLPDRDPEDRHFDQPFTPATEITTDVELYTATGRVKVAQ